jgi:hypothetical protein
LNRHWLDWRSANGSCRSARLRSRRRAQAVAGEREEQELTAAEQHAAEAAERPRGLGRETSDLKAREQWLTDAVKAAAKREAETVVKAAREQARLILETAKARREPPAESAQPDEPVEEPDSAPP